MDKDESYANCEEAEQHHAQELEQLHKEMEDDQQDRHLQKIEDEVDRHLAISIDVHKSFSFALEYMKQSKKLNRSQHIAIMQYTNTEIKKRSNQDD
tara:strand:+ start:426 stop:713 length:288 start_codon:yes stop_codon:yes gene_type:complete